MEFVLFIQFADIWLGIEDRGIAAPHIGFSYVLMRLNVKKFEFIHFGKENTLK